MAKPFQTYDDLLIFLKNEKNLVIEDTDYAKHILAKTSYFSLLPPLSGNSAFFFFSPISISLP